LPEWQREHPEHREAEIETLMYDLHGTMEFIADLTQLAYDGDYHERSEAPIRWQMEYVVPKAQEENDS
jgi:hypothetical protein